MRTEYVQISDYDYTYFILSSCLGNNLWLTPNSDVVAVAASSLLDPPYVEGSVKSKMRVSDEWICLMRFLGTDLV